MLNDRMFKAAQSPGRRAWEWGPPGLFDLDLLEQANLESVLPRSVPGARPSRNAPELCSHRARLKRVCARLAQLHNFRERLAGFCAHRQRIYSETSSVTPYPPSPCLFKRGV